MLSKKQWLVFFVLTIIVIVFIYCVALYFSSQRSALGWTGLQLSDVVVVWMGSVLPWLLASSAALLIYYWLQPRRKMFASAVPNTKSRSSLKKNRSPFSAVVKWLTLVVFGAAVILVLYGLLQDALGVNCHGLFGVKERCVTYWLMSDAILLLSPPFLVIGGFIWLLALIDQYNRNH